MAPSVYRKLAFDLARDLAPVILTVQYPFILIAHPGLPASNVKELAEHVRARPGQVTYASTGSGSIPHLTGAQFALMSNASMVHVSYKGAAPAMVDLLSGQVQVAFMNPLTAMPHIKTGRIRAFAVSTARRASVVPDLPTMQEAGYKDFDHSA